jgi:hypothetical protein
MFKKIGIYLKARARKAEEARIAKQKQAATDRINKLMNRGDIISNKPEGIALKLYDKDYNSYIECIFTTVGGRIFATDNILPGNRFKTKMSNGKTAVWSIMTKEIENWKWDTCHRVKGLFVGWLQS